MTFKGANDEELSLWNEEDGLYYDAIQFSPGNSMQLPIRSLVGLIPLYATLTLEPSVINRFPGFKKRMEWFIENRPEVSKRNMANMKRKLSLFHSSVYGLNGELVCCSWRKGRSTPFSALEQRAFDSCLGEDAR